MLPVSEVPPSDVVNENPETSNAGLARRGWCGQLDSLQRRLGQRLRLR